MDQLIPSSQNTLSPLHPSRSELPLLQETFKAFLQNYSKSTAIAYKAEISLFLQFISKNYAISSPQELTRNQIINYRTHLSSEKNYSNKAILKKLSAISSFCKFLAEEKLVDKDILYGVKRPKTQNQKETADISDKDVRRLFDSMKDKHDVYTVHHRALLAVGFYTGLRSSEIRYLTLKSYAKAEGHMLLRCLIKGDKIHEIALNPFVVRCLDEHIAKLTSMGFDLNPEHYLFPAIKTKQNKPIQAKSLWNIFKKRIEKAGIELSAIRRYSPHTMRATLAGHLLNTIEAPLAHVQQALGHASPSTTMKYNKRENSHDKSPVYKIDY